MTPEYKELLVSFWVMFAVFMIVMIILAITYSFYKVTFRKHEHVYCMQLLKEEAKITDPADLEYLTKIEPKLRSYADKWWYNNGFSFISRRNKMRKIAKKYNLKIKVWND